MDLSPKLELTGRFHAYPFENADMYAGFRAKDAERSWQTSCKGLPPLRTRSERFPPFVGSNQDHEDVIVY